MSTKLVTSRSELLSALKAVQGGDTILLADGDYGSLVLDSKYLKNIGIYDIPVAIRALNPGEASFGNIDLKYVQNLDFDGLEVRGTLKAWYNSSDIGIRNSEVTSVHLRNATDVELINNDIGSDQMGIVVLNSSNVKVQNNYIHGVYEDMMRVVGNSGNVLIENNYFYDPVPGRGKHSDNIQMWSEGGKTPHDITIRGNIFYDDPETGATSSQGIFMASPSASGYKNILIEQNLMSVEQPNTIFINSGRNGENVVIQNNSLVTGKGELGAKIQLTGNASHAVTVDGNVAVGYRDVSGSATLGDNHFFGTGAWYYASQDQTNIYQDPDTTSWKGFLPVAGSAIDFGSSYGAQERLKELLAGVENDFGATRLVTEAAGAQSFRGISSSWAELAAFGDDRLALSEGTISLTFEASTVDNKNWYHQRAIIAKDATGLGDGFSAVIDDGTLVIRFEDDTGVQTISHAGLQAGTAYDLTVSFEDGLGRAWLDGNLIGSVETHMDWSDNAAALIVGADNGSTEMDGSRLRSFFSGTISNVRIYDEGMTHKEVSPYNAVREADLALLKAAGDLSKVAAYHGGIETFGNKTSDRVVVENGHDMPLTEGTIVLNFNPDITYGGRGLVAKDSAGLGNGFYAAISGGTLKIVFEDDQGAQTISHSGVERYTDYHLVTSFGDGKASAWLNGELIGTVATQMDWTDNHDQIVLGATTGQSAAGSLSNLKSPYDGTINGLLVLNESMTAQEVAAYIDAHPTLIV
ncbi:hypothetical protein CDV52_08985 [Haematobacter missouriensis]|uniref:Uncharacterized protein n=1 Tax=Haematobacter missouriensis TaxID=366616 RepID=A0A212AR73_9RHOB|nr:LamG-like jellyroll fold domain-containing protein [Haematobacter missouriensis]OWJ84017.1 hypothetical protein CDV52_08985 [Haematobacter missouriensis]